MARACLSRRRDTKAAALIAFRCWGRQAAAAPRLVTVVRLLGGGEAAASPTSSPARAYAEWRRPRTPSSHVPPVGVAAGRGSFMPQIRPGGHIITSAARCSPSQSTILPPELHQSTDESIQG